MAKALKTLKFPGIAETYTVPVVDDTLSIEGAAADAKAVYDAIQTIQGGGAIGSLPDMTGILPATKGGTGLNSVPADNFIVGSGSTEMVVKTAEQTRTLIGAAKESEVLALSGGTMTGAINMGGQLISNLATPTADAHAATKAYVDAQIAQSGSNDENGAILFDGTCAAGTAVSFIELLEGDSVEIIYQAPVQTSNLDITFNVNSLAPTENCYYYDGSNYEKSEGALLARGGTACIGTFEGTLKIFNGTAEVSGQGRRGSGDGIGIANAIWSNVSSVSSVTFSVGGHLRIRKISNALTNLTNKVFYGSTQPTAEIGAIWLKPIE